MLGSLSPLAPGSAMAASEVQPEHPAVMRDAPDSIVAGAGSAGCVLAARLAEGGADVLVRANRGVRMKTA